MHRLTVKPRDSPPRPLSVTGSLKSASEVAQALVDRKGATAKKAVHASGKVPSGGASRIQSAGKAAVVVHSPVTQAPPSSTQDDNATADDVGGSELDIEGEALGNCEASADAASISDDDDFQGRPGIKGTGAPASKKKGTDRRRAQFEPGERPARHIQTR